MWEGNSSLLWVLVRGPPPCQDWADGTEDGLYQLGSVLLALGYMGGSGAFGGVYMGSCLLLAFLCQALWGWLSVCAAGVLAWGVLLGALCLLRLGGLLLRLRWDALPGGELGALYQAVFRPLGAPPAAFRRLSQACGGRVWALGEEQDYAQEGTTPIDQLSFLLSGRVRVSLDGQFVQYIFPFQFLDSPEWESLRPMEEGKYQVTLTAETDCRYVSWPRRRLQALLAGDRYLAHLFSVLLGSDIADKLYALNQRLFIKRGLILDIRLPGLYFALAPPSPSADPFSAPPPASGIGSSPGDHGDRGDSRSRPSPARTTPPPGGDPPGLALEGFSEVAGSLGEYTTDGQYLK